MDSTLGWWIKAREDETRVNQDEIVKSRKKWPAVVALVVIVAALGGTGYLLLDTTGPRESTQVSALRYEPRQAMDVGGFTYVNGKVKPWEPEATLQEISTLWQRVGYRNIEALDRQLADAKLPDAEQVRTELTKSVLYNYEGEPAKAYEVLKALRTRVTANDSLAAEWLYTIIYVQGVTALRRGENENCIACRGESSCILPIVPGAVHVNPEGSRLAIQHFTEYLFRFPDDDEVRWLLNLAHMTLGEHPAKVDPAFLITLDRFNRSEFDLGRFRDVGHLVGINRLNQAGGCVMEDFDNDGRLDIVMTSFDPTAPMVYFWNRGDGTFEDRTEAASVADQLGGLFCCQADFDNDGWMDVFIPRGAWQIHPMRPSLLRNRGDGAFADVTRESGLLHGVTSNSACWADYDNDGWLDLFVCCEQHPNRLYHNKGDGTFEEVATKAGLLTSSPMCKGAVWFDYDNDGYPDLFLNYLAGTGQLYHNNRDGTFTDVAAIMGINGPKMGFSCWAFDFDNDGWLDVFATSYDRSVKDVVNGLIGKPHFRQSSRLYRNLEGKGFKDVAKTMGLDMVFATMGSNFGDFDNDGYPDVYLATGDPDLSMLVPNRMFKNVGGQRFAEVTGSSRTGNLQKGHAVACGDWDRNGTVDLAVEMGGAINGDKYHNVLLQNPGQGNNWLTVKLVGKRTNRAAIGARIKATIGGPQPLTVHACVSSGSSFGANPLQQHLGLGKADHVEELEITWPTSGTKQVFRNVAANQAILITEFASEYAKLDWSPIPLPSNPSQ